MTTTVTGDTVDRTASRRRAIAGDMVVLILLVVVGFASHAELSAIPRMVGTVVVFGASWFLVAPFFGLFDVPALTRPVDALWRTALAWLVAAPLGAFLRSVALDRATIVVVFVMVTIAVNGTGLVLWRTALAWWNGRRTATRRPGPQPAR